VSSAHGGAGLGGAPSGVSGSSLSVALEAIRGKVKTFVTNVGNLHFNLKTLTGSNDAALTGTLTINVSGNSKATLRAKSPSKSKLRLVSAGDNATPTQQISFKPTISASGSGFTPRDFDSAFENGENVEIGKLMEDASTDLTLTIALDGDQARKAEAGSYSGNIIFELSGE